MNPTAIKLTQPGSSITIAVQNAAMATVGKFPEMIFTGIEDASSQAVSITLPKSSADRQLGRLSLDMARVAGELLTFSRDPNPSGGAAYWGITRAEPSNLPAKGPIVAPRASQTPNTAPVDDTPPPDDQDAPAGVRVATPIAVPNLGKLDAIFAMHERCFTHAIRLGDSMVGGLKDEALSALTAQVFIAAQQRGL